MSQPVDEHGAGTAELRRLGLQMDPFRAEARGAFLYTDAHWQARLDAVHALVSANARPVMVLGEHGLGKTTLLDELLHRTTHEWQACRVEAHAQVGVDALIEQVLNALDAPPTRNLQEAIERVSERCAKLHDAGRLPVIAVDDADRLTPQVLATVVTLREGAGNPPALLLLGTPRMENALSDEAFRSRSSTSPERIALAPFNASQTSAYLEHRLAAAGLQRETPLGPSVVAMIHRESGGIPARINDEASRALGRATAPGEMTGPSLTRRWATHIASAAVGAILTLIAVTLLTPDVGPGTDERRDTSARSTRALELPPPKRGGGESPPEAPQPKADGSPTARSSAPPGDTSRERSNPTATSSRATPTDGAAAPSMHAQRGGDPDSTPSSPPAELMTLRAPSASEPGGPSTGQPQSDAPSDDTLRGVDWVTGQPRGAYTLQLAAVRERERLQGFVERHRLEPPLAAVRTRRADDGEWYVLLQGSYADTAAARDALGRLPEAVRGHGPWVRRFASLQDQLAQNPPKP